MTAARDAAVILVVDDDPASLEVAALLLEREGYRTRRASGGRECLAIVASERVDLVLLDVMMPEMDGFEVCAELRRTEPGSRVPVVLLTARDDVDTRLEGMHQGVSEFLTKPINRVELLARVRSQLHIVALTRQLETVERNLEGARKRQRPGPTPGRP
jgi:two-component system cell cycle response regulator